jgi:coproporphyrinogen III oxidase
LAEKRAAVAIWAILTSGTGMARRRFVSGGMAKVLHIKQPNVPAKRLRYGFRYLADAGSDS